ncbi:glycosyltransferase [Acidicapsa ligni]|uniref:glycosyltransferase n=1 Tax=Acidicapsa ligni TaxID=542300 RepID=UPI0021DF8C36|nr:glycosyltransferase [Acidicapsa ligni]
MKLLLIIPHLGGGGAERVTAQLARHLNPDRFEIHLALITDDAPGAEPPPEWVSIHRLHATRVRSSWLQIVKLIWNLRPAIVLSGMVHLNALLLLLKPLLPAKTKLLVRQNTTASASAKMRSARWIYRHLYPRANRIICQSAAMANDLAINFSLPPTSIEVLPNPIDTEAIQTATSQTESSHTGPHLLSIGRLAPEKGIDLLLYALPTVRQIYPQAKLTILGIGPLRDSLTTLSEKLALTNAVHFAGHDIPANYYNQTTLFVLPSRYEGMPNALLEAAAAGLPLVSTPCCEGVRELLANAPGTWLSHEITAPALAQSILTALEATADYPQQPARFTHAFLAPFELTNAISTWEAFLLSIAHEAHA